MMRSFHEDALEDVPLDDPPSPHDTDDEWEHLEHRFDVPNTPSSASEDAPMQFPSDAAAGNAVGGFGDEAEAEVAEEAPPRRKPDGYESRIEKILYENPELPILITDAGKSLESGGKYIVYTIRTGVRTHVQIQDGSPFIIADLTTEPRSPSSVFRVPLSARCPRAPSPHLDHPAHS